jgi:hypothetical protein
MFQSIEALTATMQELAAAVSAMNDKMPSHDFDAEPRKTGTGPLHRKLP